MNQNQNQPLALPEIVPDSGGTQHELGALMLEIVTDSEFTPIELGMLMAFCHQHVPTHNIAFVEGVCVIAAYVKMGFIDLSDANHVNNFKFSSIDYKTNQSGRITKLVIAHNRITENGVDDEHDDYVPYHLSKDILRLRKLEDLRVVSSSCGIPDDCDLAALPHLKVLGLFGNHYMSARIVPSNMKLPRLECFIIEWLDLRLSPSTNVLPWMTHQLTNLKHLQILYSRSGVIEPFLDALNNNTVCFQESLEKLTFEGCTKMIKLVLPRFVRLKMIELFDERTKSFKFLSTVTATIPLPRTIHTFFVWPNQFIPDIARDDLTERTAILNFLEMNNCVYNLMGDYQQDYLDYHPEIKYPLLINHAGRSMIDNGESKDNHKKKNSRSSIAPSLLPTLLARSYHHSDDIYPVGSSFRGTKDHTGVYYLLRNSIPALIVTLDVTMDN